MAPACALVVFFLPRPLVPSQLPTLELDRELVRAVLEADAKQATALPVSKWVDQLDESVLEQGRVDDQLGEMRHARHARRAARLVLVDKVRQLYGDNALIGLRARAVQRLDRLLSGALPASDAPGILGLFPNFLARHGVTRAGGDMAPTFVSRTLYKARWNGLCGLEPAFQFAQVEVRTLFGWQALHTRALAIPRRLAALSRYEAAGGGHVDEARGVLLFINGEYAAAEAALQRAYERRRSLRLRNYALGAQVAARAVAGGAFVDPPGGIAE